MCFFLYRFVIQIVNFSVDKQDKYCRTYLTLLNGLNLNATEKLVVLRLHLFQALVHLFLNKMQFDLGSNMVPLYLNSVLIVWCRGNFNQEGFHNGGIECLTLHACSLLLFVSWWFASSFSGSTTTLLFHHSVIRAVDFALCLC